MADDELIALLELEPMTASRAQREYGQGCREVAKQISRLHQAGRVHIATWRRDDDEGYSKVHIRAVWAAGPGVDAPQKVHPLTPSQRTDRYRKAHKTEVRARTHYRRTGAVNPWLQLMRGRS